MALHAYMTIAADTIIKGAAQQTGREGKIVVFGVRHDIVSPTDPDGMPIADKTKFGPVVVRKNFDSASAPLHAAHVLGKQLSKVTIEFYRIPPRGYAGTGGGEENYMTIVLTGAKVISYRTIMDDTRRTENMTIPEYEEVSFAYEAVHWKYSAAKELAADSTNIAVKYRREEFLEERVDRVINDFLRDIPKLVSEGFKDAIKSKAQETVTPEKK